jgi:hypothetical protein
MRVIFFTTPQKKIRDNKRRRSNSQKQQEEEEKLSHSSLPIGMFLQGQEGSYYEPFTCRGVFILH